MRGNQRKITVKLIDSNNIHNYRLLAEYFAKEFEERNVSNVKN